MRHSKITALVCFSILALLFSCTKMEESGNKTAMAHQFSVEGQLLEIEQNPDVKAYLGSFISANWNEGDKVSVVNLTTGKVLGGSLVSGNAGIKTTFSGTVTGTINSGDQLALIYPDLNEANETDYGDRRQIDLSTQQKSTGVPLVAYATFSAQNATGEISGLSLSFYYAMSFMKINMANLPSGGEISKVKIKNVPVLFSMSINGSGDGFDIATSDEKSAKGTIEVNGPFTINPTGALSIAIGVMPSDQSDSRRIVVSVNGQGEYISPLAAAKLSPHKYYNTVASQFEQFQLEGKQEYGIYNLSTKETLDEYEEIGDTVMTGTENGENDFLLMNTSSKSFWHLKGIPTDAVEGTSFGARLYSQAICNITDRLFGNARVMYSEPDGDFSKVWVKAGDYVFIIRK